MIQDVFGIKEFQTKLPEIARKIREVGGHYLVTNRNKPALVALSFEEYKTIEDILLELNSPALLEEIETARREYRRGKTTDFRGFLKQVDE